MKTGLIKLVDVVLKHIEENPGKRITENGLRKWLTQLGYTKRDIDSVLKILKPCFSKNTAKASLSQTLTVRPFTTEELKHIKPEARDFLARLDIYGLIEPHEREALIHKIMTIDAPIGLEEMEYLLSWLIFTGRDVETQQAFLKLIEPQKIQFM